MKHGDWLASSDLIQMLEILEKRNFRARLYRLFTAACGRRAWLAPPGGSQARVECQQEPILVGGVGCRQRLLEVEL
jgi:hypothetical protein